jgi:hypothetical protein
MTRRILLSLALATVLFPVAICHAQAAPARGGARGTPATPAKPAAPAVVTPAQRRDPLEALLKSGNKAQIDQAFVSYKAWFKEDDKAAETVFA